MKFSLIVTIATASLAFGAKTASAQVIIPHNGHYHVVPARPIVPLGYTPGFGLGYGAYSPSIVKFPSIQPNYFGVPTYLGGPVVVPPTYLTPSYLTPYRGLPVAPYTTPLRVIRW